MTWHQLWTPLNLPSVMIRLARAPHQAMTEPRLLIRCFHRGCNRPRTTRAARREDHTRNSPPASPLMCKPPPSCRRPISRHTTTPARLTRPLAHSIKLRRRATIQRALVTTRQARLTVRPALRIHPRHRRTRRQARRTAPRALHIRQPARRTRRRGMC